MDFERHEGMERATDEYLRVCSERDEAVALLRGLEWIHDDEYGLPFCHECSNGKANGHRADCRIGAFLEKVGR